MNWQISSALGDTLLAAAASDPGREVCGLLFGKPGSITSVQPCRNVADDPATTFEIDPAALIAAHKAARSGGPAIVGCYHSHPNGREGPSDHDARSAGQGLWIVIAGGALRAWFADGKGQFSRVSLSPLPAESPSAKDGANQGI
jgi:desampylase